MSTGSSIEWTEVTWNPVTGCDRVSPGCDHCYALRLADRLKAMGQPHYQRDGDPRTSGPGFAVTTHPGVLGQPLRWARPRLVFVNSMSDLFHPRVPDEFIIDVFTVMAHPAARRHTFQVLTKRPHRARSLLAMGGLASRRVRDTMMGRWPLPNVWLGVSAEDQARADRRVPVLLDIPVAVRFISAEPLLGPLDLTKVFTSAGGRPTSRGVGWVIAGGESGPGARPAHPDWFRSLRDQASAAGVAFFFKQWGAHAPEASAAWTEPDGSPRGAITVLDRRGRCWGGMGALAPPDAVRMHRVGKHRAGRLLDGRTWDQMPAPPAIAA